MEGAQESDLIKLCINFWAHPQADKHISDPKKHTKVRNELQERASLRSHIYTVWVTCKACMDLSSKCKL